MSNLPKPIKPDWKEPRHLREQRISTERMASPLGEVLPNAGRRIAYLAEPEKDLTELLDFLQSEGVPMGSETWALRARLLFDRLRKQNLVFQRFLRDLESQPVEALLGRLRDDLAHERAMACKARPPMRCACDWCGWDGARPIGDGNTACLDCFPAEEREATP